MFADAEPTAECRNRFIAPPASACKGSGGEGKGLHPKVNDVAIEQPNSNPHIMDINKGMIVMRKLVAVFAGLGLIFAAFAGLALAFVLGIIATGAVVIARLTGKLKPVTRGHHAASGERRGQAKDYRVWNDGRGTIIDM